MQYSKCDVVEVITSKYKSWNEIPSHEQSVYEHNQSYPILIGSRFMVESMDDDGMIKTMVRIGMYGESKLPFDTVILYKKA